MPLNLLICTVWNDLIEYNIETGFLLHLHLSYFFRSVPKYKYYQSTKII